MTDTCTALGQFESGLGLWANRRYLLAARVRIPTVAHPWTLAGIRAGHGRYRAARVVEYPLNLAVYARTSESYSYAYSPILQGFGGDLIDRSAYGSARGVLDGPQSVAAMTRFQNWFKRGWTHAVFDPKQRLRAGQDCIVLEPGIGSTVTTMRRWAKTSYCYPCRTSDTASDRHGLVGLGNHNCVSKSRRCLGIFLPT